MEVILLEDVRTLGKKGQIVKINDGYARNYVIPKKLGIEATPKNLNDLKLQKKREEKEAAEKMKEDGVTINDQVDIEAFKEASESIYSTYEGWSDDLVEKCQKTLAEIRGE